MELHQRHLTARRRQTERDKLTQDPARPDVPTKEEYARRLTETSLSYSSHYQRAKSRGPVTMLLGNKK